MSDTVARSVKSKLVKLAGELDRDFNGLALEFAIERLVVRLQQDPKLLRCLIFKGGFVMLKAYGSDRATVDLDTSLQNLSIEEAEKLVVKAIAADLNDGLWMGSIETRDLDHQTEYSGRRLTIRFSFGFPQTDFQRLGKLILDIGVADIITPKAIDGDLHPLLGGLPLEWKIYPVETIVAEKLHALVARGSQSSRFKDVYDLTILLPQCKNKSLLTDAIKKTFEHRATEVPISFSKFWIKLDKTVLQRSAAAVQLALGGSPDFDGIKFTLETLLKDGGL